MSEARHTPGRWFHEPCTDTVRRYTNQEKGWLEHADGQQMADAMNACEGLADPSAVPDLLAALRGLLAVINDSDQREPKQSMRLLSIVSGKPEFAAVDAARSAIRKATGTTN